jgi:DNA repair photolyase
MWTLSPPNQARLIEPATASCANRVEAARLAEENGIVTRYKFKPIVPLKGWEEDASKMIEMLFDKTNPDNLSMGLYIFNRYDDMIRMFDPKHIDEDFLNASKEANSDDQFRWSPQAPFPFEYRKKVYEHYINEIRKYDSEVPLALSSESPEMWDALGETLGSNVHNYVCGCGTTATPCLKKLDESPFELLKNIRDEKGEAVEIPHTRGEI